MGITAVVPPSAMAGEAVHNSPKRRCHVVSAAHVRRFPRGDPNGDHLHNRVEHPDIFLAVASEEVAHNTGTAPILTGFPSAMATACRSGSAGVVLMKWDVVPPAAQTIIDVQIEKIQKMSK